MSEPTFDALCGGRDNRKMPETVTINRCCWVCEFLKRKTVGEGGLGPGMRAWICSHPDTYNDETVVLPYNTKCRHSFQLKKELAE